MVCLVCGQDSDVQVQAQWAAGEASACQHGACAACLLVWIDGQRSWHVPLDHMNCFHPGCVEKMPHALVCHIYPEQPTLSKQRSSPRDLASQLWLAKMRRSMTEEALVWASNGELVCAACQEPRSLLLANGSCRHAACEECWITWSSECIRNCRAQRMRSTGCLSCLVPGCGRELSPALEQHVERQSGARTAFELEVHDEVKRLELTAKDVLAWSAAPSELGPVCSSCDRRCLALLVNPDCKHAACEDCWTQWAEQQLPRCRSKLLSQLYGTCCERGCCAPMSPTIERHACSRSLAVRTFRRETDAHLTRLSQFSSEILFLGPRPSDAGPECPVCCEPHLALLRNPECDHVACEDCWASWASTQVERCRSEKSAALRCLGPNCGRPTITAIWAHAATRNDVVASLERKLAYRRRLQANELYPAAVQFDCPIAGCLGLGYLGFDKLMCFACEHQWSSDEAVAASSSVRLDEDADLELAMGEAMKKCPSCGMHIIKNGGCDHMTCRCKHEFWWTTLQPFHS